jgi:hypothetical protein
MVAQVLQNESFTALFRGSTILAVRSATFSVIRFSLEYLIPP